MLHRRRPSPSTQVWVSAVSLFALVLAGCPSESASDPAATNETPAPGSCGRLSTPCPKGGACEGAPDCASGLCRDGVCGEITPPNGVKDNDETDVDCGGTQARACEDGKNCGIGADCVNGVCTGNVCQAPTATDGVKNGDETDKDCGGTSAPGCKQGQGCRADSDCDNLKCDTAANVCKAPANDDGFKNGGETGTDCGGTAPKKCPPNEGCNGDGDCDNVRCDTVAKKCMAPSPTDTLKNGDETDIDCGGTVAPKCALGKTCVAPTDCLSDGCDYQGKCIKEPSCAPHYGGDTCGRGEVGQAGAQHESCCASLPINGTTRVDKYEITAGRMREFVKRTNGNVYQWVMDHRDITGQISDAMLVYLPQSNTAPVRTFTQCQPNGTGCTAQAVNFGLYGHLGNTVFMADRPCPNCGQGCFVNEGQGAYGHPTYYWDKTTQETQWTASERDFDQNTLDTKSLNCVAQLMLAAFCAWDGGRLPTMAELGGTGGAWGPATYPWGATPSYKDTWNGAADVGRAQYQAFDNNGNPTGIIDGNAWFSPMINPNNAAVVFDAPDRNVTNWNPFGWSTPQLRYAFPQRPFATWARVDGAYAVASPGRMHRDRRSTGAGALDGWFDLAANLMEVTGDIIGGTDDANHNSLPRDGWVGGSFEGHDVGRNPGQNHTVLTKYGKQGGRCARPL